METVSREVGSGAVAREQRQQLIDAARRREIDVVLVWRLDRSLTDLSTTRKNSLTSTSASFQFASLAVAPIVFVINKSGRMKTPLTSLHFQAVANIPMAAPEI